MTTEIVTVPLYVLNRLALALVAVIRYHASNAVIAAFGPSLTPRAEQFNAAYTRIGALKSAQSAAVRTSAQHTGALYQTMMSWFGRVTPDLPDFDPRGFGSRPEVTLDVLTDARRLLQVVESHGASLNYAQALLADLHPLIEVAESAHEQAQDSRRELQELQALTRELAADLQRHLIAFRRSVRSELGTSHVDYQRLRAERGRKDLTEELDTMEVDAAPDPVVAADPTLPTNGHTRAPNDA